jgi:hypothetical protein
MTNEAINGTTANSIKSFSSDSEVWTCQFRVLILIFLTCLHSYEQRYGPYVDSACNRIEYPISGGKDRPVHKPDNVTAIYTMWDPQHLMILCASTACYRDDFTFTI